MNHELDHALGVEAKTCFTSIQYTGMCSVSSGGRLENGWRNVVMCDGDETMLALCLMMLLEVR